MWERVKRYTYDRRRGLITTTSVLATIYFAGRYVLHRLEEIKESAMEAHAARENLRRRFQQNMQDCTYTIMALLPTLGTRILEELDVERISLELQSRSAKHQRPSVLPSLPTPTPATPLSGENLLASIPSVISDTPLQSHEQPAQDVGSPAPSNIALSTNGEDVAVDQMAQSMTSWATASEAASAPTTVDAESIKSYSKQPSISSGPMVIDPLLESTTSGSRLPTHSSTSQSGDSSALAPPSNSTLSDAYFTSDSPYPPHPLAQKSKAELWADLKLQTFTRTLTVIYSITLLSLQTHVQLNLLGRAKYLQSVRALESEERAKEGPGLGEMLFFGGRTSQPEDDEEEREGTEGWEEVDEDVERKYLTFSWWLLHIGWRELAERVRVAVEEVLDGVSLKTRLGIDDLRTLINQVRLKIEETEEGSDGARADFTSILLPPRNSPEEQNVLIQGGISPHLAEIDPPLRTLLDEMRGYVSSAEFAFVLDKGAERAVEVLLDSLDRDILSTGPGRRSRPGSVLGGEGVIEEVKMERLAGLLPGIARWCHTALYGLPNEVVEALVGMREVAGFSAIIYAEFGERV